MNKRVVITGMGIYSCLGANLTEVRNSLFQGKSGIIYDEPRKALGFRSALTGMVPPPQLKSILDRRTRVSMAEQVDYAYLSTLEALSQAGLDQDFLDQHVVGVLFGNDSSTQAVIEGYEIAKAKKDNTLIGSGAIFKGMNSTVSMNLSTIFHLKGINLSISAACASGSHAIGLGYLLIKSGFQEMIICGGAQEINPSTMASFDGLSAFSMREHEPTKASRPFDRDRDGLVPSGGAATLILESYESAIQRGATILAEVIGYGFSSNGNHIIQPDVDGPARSLANALKDAQIQAADIDYINAHATSTPVGDTCEARAIHQIFGDSKPWVSSTKSMTGHECWMAGASELVYSLLMMQNSFVAPNINLENPDEDATLLNLANQTIETQLNTILSNSFGFGGTNSSIILRKISKI